MNTQIDEILTDLVRAAADWGDYQTEPGWQDVLKEQGKAKAALTRLLLEQRLDELTRIDGARKKNMDIYWNHRRAELQEQLNKKEEPDA